MMKNDDRVESSIYIAFNAIISERKESTGFLLTLRRVRIVVRLAAGLSRFLVQAYRPSLGGATRKRTALPPHAPPLKPIWRQAS